MPIFINNFCNKQLCDYSVHLNGNPRGPKEDFLSLFPKKKCRQIPLKGGDPSTASATDALLRLRPYC